MYEHRRRPGAEFGETPDDKISPTKIFERLIFWKKFLMTFFSHQLYFVCLLPVSTVQHLVYNIYDPFSS